MKILTTDSLAQLIAEQCNDISAADARTYIVQRLARGESDYEWVFTSERTEDQLREAALSEVEMALSRTTITVSDVHFNANGTPHAFAPDTLLAVVPKIRFKSCHFYTSTVGEHGVSSRFDFEDCTFHALWQQPLPEMSLSGSALYKACMFEQGISLTDGGLDVGYEALFSDCNIRQLTLKSVRLKHARLFDNSLCGGATLGELSVQDCNIQTKFTLDNIKGISRITLNSSKFKDKFAMIACEIGALDIVNTNFKGLVDFYQTRFDSLKIKKSIFKDFVGFEQCTLGPADASSGVIEMRYVTFYSFMNFRQTRFNQPLDLRNTNRADQPNFLDCSFGEIARTHTDRETFRIIKQSFEAVGNRIEANVFFAHEMEAYRRELRQKRRERRVLLPSAEELLLWLNAVISQHGQSYGWPLLWLLGTAGLFALQQANWPHRWVSLPALLATWVLPAGEFLNTWAKGLVFFQPLYTKFEGPEALILLVAVALSTFTWHLLVAVRRHNRR